MVQYGQYEVPSSEKMVNFGVGQPSKTLLPLSKIKKGMLELMQENDVSLLQYGDIPGYYEFRKDLGKYLTGKYDKEVRPENLFITNGVTGGLSLICSLFTNKDTIVFVEEPTYFLAINIFRDFGLEVRPIPIEEDGINVSYLERELKNVPTSKNIMLYTIPTFHNPTSYTMSVEKRELIGTYSSRYNMLVVADEVYQLLYFDDADRPPMPMHYFGDNIISLGSFSKILAPSLRLGWIQTSESIMKKIVSCGQLDSSGGINPFVSAIVHRIINNDDLEKNILEVRRELKERCDTLCDSVRSESKQMVFLKPRGGYFLWIHLAGLDTIEMLDSAIESRVRYHSGNKFSANNELKDYLRLSFSYYNVEDMSIGAERLSNVIAAEYKSQIVSNKVHISVNGYGGRLGSKIVDILGKNDRYEIKNLIGKEKEFELNRKERNIIIDVSSVEGTRELISYLIANEYWVPLLIGTTGDLPYELIKRYSSAAPVAIISNFSNGIPQMLEFLRNSRKDDWNIRINETHHVGKRDSPSGTAKTISSVIGGEIPINSIRNGEVYGEHEVIMENDNERLTISHEAKNRDIFAYGAIDYIDWLLSQPRGLYTSRGKSGFGFQKYSGTGNTFIMLDNRNKIVSNYEKEDFVKLISDDNKGVGSDGVIFLEGVDNYENMDFMWEYYNKDGSNVEMCGNGARAVAKYYYDNIEKKDKLYYRNNFGIETKAIIEGSQVRVTMPQIENLSIELGDKIMNELKVDNIKFLGGYNVGVPHLVFNIQNLSFFDVNKYCSYLLKNFGTLKNFNLNFTCKNMNEIAIRTYERGVWRETEACGSGCCASGHLYRDLMKSNEIMMRVKSGELLKVIYGSNGEVMLEGRVKKLFEGVI